MAAPVIRVIRFRCLRPGFDASLRSELIPGLRTKQGLLGVAAGRHGPDELGWRLVASVWASDAARTAALRDGASPFACLSDPAAVADVEFEDLTVRVLVENGSDGAPGIIRELRGHIRPGELDAYIEEARNGTIADRESGGGPLALYLGTSGSKPDEFLTVSTWADWSAIERATGGDIRRPLATRHPERIVGFGVTHYEAIDL